MVEGLTTTDHIFQLKQHYNCESEKNAVLFMYLMTPKTEQKLQLACNKYKQIPNQKKKKQEEERQIGRVFHQSTTLF